MLLRYIDLGISILIILIIVENVIFIVWHLTNCIAYNILLCFNVKKQFYFIQ